MGEFQGVADTLFIPLEGRIYVSKKFPDYFYDAKALELEPHIPNRSVRKRSPEYSLVAPAARHWNLDQLTREFCAQHERCNVVNLGAGLDTTAERLQLPQVNFYGVDLPEVIETRRKLLPTAENETMIGCDLFDLAWAEQLDRSLPTLFVASGVFYYFDHDRVVGLIQALKANFGEAELIFDATNRAGLKIANAYVRSTGNKTAAMGFYIDDPAAFAETCGVKLLSTKPFYVETRKLLGKRLKWLTRLAMWVGDTKKQAHLIRLQLN